MTSQERTSTPAAGLRERNKAKRRDLILDSTLDLLRESSLAEVSMERIAARAELAPATIYNLMGTRDQLLLACVSRVLDRLIDALVTIDPTEDPIGAATAIVLQSADAFIADGRAFRQIIAGTREAAAAGTVLAIDPAQLQIAAMRAAQDRGLLRPDVDPAAVGRQIFVSYNGAMFAWAAHLLSDDGFRRAALHGLWTALAAFASDRHRRRFTAHLDELGPELTAAGWGSG
ncbi:MAG: TetR/AcrR family transcriptional regulator [Acidimicrobiales bacterium]|nr:TetR/AcrR family transcriptional regulator [Acidimicrobiales bacterium]